MVRISSLLSDTDCLLSLEPEELAGVVLHVLISCEDSGDRGHLHRNNFVNAEAANCTTDTDKQREIAKALVEAWIWLEREGLIAPQPGQSADWVFVTRRARQIGGPAGLGAYRKANQLPKAMLHPQIATKVWAPFLRGDHDTAIFQAFKEVEVATRQAGQLGDEDLGVGLMRKAFHPSNGPLRDPSALPAEQQAASDLFAGAIGLYKNPHSHRNVSEMEPLEAVEIIILASHLLRVVHQRPGGLKRQ